jgi:PilZ domain
MRLPSMTRGLELMSRSAADAQHNPWIERRTRNRFRLVLPVVFRWSDGTEHSAVGYCRNIGLEGIFIVTSNCPPADIEIEIDVVVPAFDPDPKEILLRHTGRVIRIQACEDLLGFAVAGQFEDENAIQARVTAREFGQQ